MSDYLIDRMTPNDAEKSMEWMDSRILAQCAADASARGSSFLFPRMWIPDTGLVALNVTSDLMAVAFVYFEKTAPIAYCGWLVSNPSNTPVESYRAIRLLVNAIPNYARKNGARCLLTCYGNRGLNRILERSGFQNGETCETKFKLLNEKG